MSILSTSLPSWAVWLSESTFFPCRLCPKKGCGEAPSEEPGGRCGETPARAWGEAKRGERNVLEKFVLVEAEEVLKFKGGNWLWCNLCFLGVIVAATELFLLFCASNSSSFFFTMRSIALSSCVYSSSFSTKANKFSPIACLEEYPVNASSVGSHDRIAPSCHSDTHQERGEGIFEIEAVEPPIPVADFQHRKRHWKGKAVTEREV